MLSKKSSTSILLLAFLISCVSGKYEGPVSDHFNGEIFFNIDPFEEKSFWTVMKWRWSRVESDWPDWVEDPVFPLPPERVSGEDLQVTFINHTTFLIQTKGLNILTDPIWSERASPVTWAGPKRIRKAGIDFKKLPPIDLVLISHNHYDHMDLQTLKNLEEKHRPLFISSLGNKKFLENEGLKNVIELDWWQSTFFKKYKIEYVPAQHFSARSLNDRMKTLWGGFVLGEGQDQIYFSGDTATGSFLDQLQTRFPQGFRLGFLPIGSFEPRWFMKGSHMNPREAAEAHLKLKIRKSFGMHFETFKNLADEKWGEASLLLERAKKDIHIPEKTFLVPRFGESYKIE